MGTHHHLTTNFHSTPLPASCTSQRHCRFCHGCWKSRGTLRICALSRVGAPSFYLRHLSALCIQGRNLQDKVNPLLMTQEGYFRKSSTFREVHQMLSQDLDSPRAEPSIFWRHISSPPSNDVFLRKIV